MRFWGIGASGSDGDFSQKFIDENCAYINWSVKEAPTLYKMFKQISFGDIVYIKSFTVKGNVINIKGIGIVTDVITKNSNDNYNVKPLLKIKWFSKKSHKISVSGEKNNVYSNTLYEEFNCEIIEYIKQEIFKCLKTEE